MNQGRLESGRREAFARYGLAFVAVALALLLRWRIDFALLDRVPFVTLYAAVVVAAYFGGTGPALVAGLLGFLGANWLFLKPHGNPFNLNVAGALATGAYVFVTSIITWAASSARTSREHVVRVARQLGDRPARGHHCRQHDRSPCASSS